jgi:ribosomal protein L16 Arg81 hydroxylase
MFDRLLDREQEATFFAEHFLRLPYSLPGGCAELTELGEWKRVEAIIAAPDADVLVVKEGRRWEEARTPTVPEARQLFADGYTLLVRHAEWHDAEIAELARGFAADFQGPVDVHVYCTPGCEFGFGWHYDAEDVFILQCSGAKEYSLRKNTVNPWPLVEALPADMHYERELMPLMQCRLSGGDWLYIPAGYWHRAKSQTDAISLAVGVLPATALDAFDFLRRELLDSIRWRQRLPLSGDEADITAEARAGRYQDLFAELADELSATLRDPLFIQDFLESRRNTGAPGERGA